MEKKLRRQEPEKLTGMHPGLSGDCSWLRGDCSGLRGDCSGLRGNIDECALTDEERQAGVNIADLVA